MPQGGRKGCSWRRRGVVVMGSPFVFPVGLVHWRGFVWELGVDIGRSGLGGNAQATALGFHGGSPTVALDVEFEDGGPAHEPVDGGQGHGLFGEGGVPLADGLVGGDEQVELVQPAHGRSQHQFAARDLQFLHEVGGAGVQDAEAVLDEREAGRRPASESSVVGKFEDCAVLRSDRRMFIGEA